MEWFNKNQTTINTDKFQNILLSRRYVDDFHTNICGHIISRGRSLKMLGVTLDDKLNFNEHIRNMCQTASCQINALNRMDAVWRYIIFVLILIITLLVWMLCG